MSVQNPQRMLPRSTVALLEPNLVLDGCILKLTPEILSQHELRGLVLDVDDTLVSTRTAELSPDLLTWVSEIRAVADIALVSNNISHTRIRRIAKTLELPYIFGAGKPSRRKVRQAVSAMNLPFHQIGMVGDRVFTDVLVGNRLGMFTILVEPMMASDLGLSHFSGLRSLEIWISRQLGASI